MEKPSLALELAFKPRRAYWSTAKGGYRHKISRSEPENNKIPASRYTTHDIRNPQRPTVPFQAGVTLSAGRNQR